jgi:hypothetical protein
MRHFIASFYTLIHDLLITTQNLQNPVRFIFFYKDVNTGYNVTPQQGIVIFEKKEVAFEHMDKGTPHNAHTP